MFEPDVRSKCSVLNKALVTLLEIFGAPRSDSTPHSDSAPETCAPLLYLLTFLSAILKNFDNIWAFNIVTLLSCLQFEITWCLPPI